MSHGQPPYIQKIVPCECGSTEPYWHGAVDGAREYCCDDCWDLRHRDEDDHHANFDDGPQDTRDL